jgi:hypothetical protein
LCRAPSFERFQMPQSEAAHDGSRDQRKKRDQLQLIGKCLTVRTAWSIGGEVTAAPTSMQSARISRSQARNRIFRLRSRCKKGIVCANGIREANFTSSGTPLAPILKIQGDEAKSRASRRQLRRVPRDLADAQTLHQDREHDNSVSQCEDDIAFRPRRQGQGKCD